MKILEGIRATGQQKLRTLADNGDTIEITLYYLPAIQQWKMDIVSGDFELNGLRVYALPNILNQYENIIPFGIGILIPSGGEPFLINDFSSGRVQMAILTPEEVEEVDDFYIGIKDAG